MKRVLSLLALVAVAACSDGSTDLVAPDADMEALTTAPMETRAGPNDWIVVFRPGVGDPPGLARRMVNEAGGRLRFTYEHTIRGFAATLPAQALAGIRNNPNVLRIEPDLEVTAVEEQLNATWGLDRIDQRTGLSGSYVYDTQGAGITAYIIDTGIRTTHQEFGGRATRSAASDFIGDGYDGDDCDGHGTHVAGTVGGTTYGVAKAVDLVAVRVLDCTGSGSFSGVIAGVDWVTQQHLATGGPSVANMSLGGGNGGGSYTALDEAITASSDAGVVHAVAAGNSNADACNSTPASAADALTVGASTSSDSRSSFSNYGTCVDLFAPGSAITSSTAGSDTSIGTWNGTSMASPHVAGVAALMLGRNSGATPADIRAGILDNTTTGVLSNVGPGSPDRLLYSLGTPPAPPQEVPSSPESLTATASSTSQIDLTWTNTSTEQDRVEVERSDDGTNFALVATVGGTATSWSDTGLLSGTTYHYRVFAGNTVGLSPAPSNVASAATLTPAPDVLVDVASISNAQIIHQGKFTYGSVDVALMADGGAPVPPSGVTVAGDWYAVADGSAVRSASGVTGSGGTVTIESGRVNTRSDLAFCVTSLTGDGFADGSTPPICSDGFTPPGSGNPDNPEEPTDPPAPGAPSGLVASFSQKGGGRVELTWSPGGGAEVDIFRGTSADVLGLLTTTSDNGKYNDRSGTAESWYRVCLADSTNDADCTVTVPAG
ncbi:MAG TPA: S8 family serine peptidase [Longimicrobiales bacterium]|nr:S8 family serine peptidase [Longimicrobiales bacterium]